MTAVLLSQPILPIPPLILRSPNRSNLLLYGSSDEKQ